MAIITTCDGCKAEIHKDSAEIKFRADLYETGFGKHGYDLCEGCFTKIIAVVPVFGLDTIDEREERGERIEALNARRAKLDGAELTYK